MFLLDGPRLPPVHASVKMNLKLFKKVKRRMLKRLRLPSRRRSGGGSPNARSSVPIVVDKQQETKKKRKQT